MSNDRRRRKSDIFQTDPGICPGKADSGGATDREIGSALEETVAVVTVGGVCQAQLCLFARRSSKSKMSVGSFASFLIV
jgi:hypothetical protein